MLCGFSQHHHYYLSQVVRGALLSSRLCIKLYTYAAPASGSRPKTIGVTKHANADLPAELSAALYKN